MRWQERSQTKTSVISRKVARTLIGSVAICEITRTPDYDSGAHSYVVVAQMISYTILHSLLHYKLFPILACLVFPSPLLSYIYICLVVVMTLDVQTSYLALSLVSFRV